MTLFMRRYSSCCLGRMSEYKEAINVNSAMHVNESNKLEDGLEEKKEEALFTEIPKAVIKKMDRLKTLENSVIPIRLSVQELDAFQSLQDLTDRLLWGYQAIPVLARLKVKTYKFTNSVCVHNNYEFVEGYNCDPNSETGFSTALCACGKTYGVYSVEFRRWFEYGEKKMRYFWDMVLLDESRISFEEKFKFGVDEYMLHNKRPLRDLEEWNDAEVARTAYLEGGIQNTFRIKDSAVPPLIKFRAIRCSDHPDDWPIASSSLSAQFLQILSRPSLLLDIPKPDRALVFLALKEDPFLIRKMQERGDEIDDELMYFALAQSTSLLTELNPIKEDWIRAVFETLISSHAGDTKQNAVASVLHDVMRKKLPISDSLLIWSLRFFQDHFGKVIRYGYDSDAVRKAMLTIDPTHVRLFGSGCLGRPLSDELKMLALQLCPACITMVEKPTDDMLLFVSNAHPAFKILRPNLSIDEMKLIISEDPRAITRMLGPPPRELIPIALKKDPTLWNMLEGHFPREYLVHDCPVVLFQLLRNWRSENLAIIAIDALGNSTEAIEWYHKLRRKGEDWNDTHPVNLRKYFFQRFPTLESDLASL